MDSGMRLTARDQRQGRTTLAVEGCIANQQADLLETECNAILDEQHRVELDLSGVTYVDSRGAVVLRRLRRRGVTVVGCPPFILEFLDAESRQHRVQEGGDHERSKS